jgi:hypothetical protein
LRRQNVELTPVLSELANDALERVFAADGLAAMPAERLQDVISLLDETWMHTQVIEMLLLLLL